MSGEPFVRGTQPSTYHQACACVDARLEAVFARVEEVRRELLDLLAQPLAQGRVPRVDDIDPLQASLRTALDEQEDPRLAGLGYIAAVGVFEDQPRLLSWLQRSEDHKLTRLQPDLDPDSFGFYDFTAAEWFRRPRATGMRSVVGPYVDVAGTDEYVVTLTVPALLGDRFLGVCGADLRPGDLADALIPSLCGLGRDALLVNADGRVVVSTSPQWQVGARVRDRALDEDGGCRAAPWSLLALESSPLG